jgi:hypothetical protein
VRRQVAHVGAHRPFTELDDSLWARALSILSPTDLTYESKDIINLDYGRDFLQENHRYHGVVLHNVFFSHNLDPGASGLDECRTSPHGTLTGWARRLIATEARWIMVIEVAVALSARDLLPLLVPVHYVYEPTPSPFHTLFRRIT